MISLAKAANSISTSLGRSEDSASLITRGMLVLRSRDALVVCLLLSGCPREVICKWPHWGWVGHGDSHDPPRWR